MDCMDYLADVPDFFFDLAVIDPPYGIGEDGEKMLHATMLHGQQGISLIMEKTLKHHQ